VKSTDSQVHHTECADHDRSYQVLLVHLALFWDGVLLKISEANKRKANRRDGVVTA